MLKRATPSPWTCARCVRQQQQKKVAARWLSCSSSNKGAGPASAAAFQHERNPVERANPATAHDDRTLRQIFDSPDFWQEFSAKTQQYYGGRSAGLFQNRYLTRPEGFQEFADVTLQKCRKIVANVLEYSTIEGYKRISRDLDRLSDLLCRVIDLSDFVRSVHPDRKVQMAANDAYALMFEYMNVLNTTPGLEQQLKTAAGMPEVYTSWSEEEKTVANILMKDFSKSAIELPDADRQAFVDMSNDVAQVGTAFTEAMSPETPLLELPSSKLKGMDPLVVRQLTKWGTARLPTVGMPAMLALRTVEDVDTRRDIYMANRTSSMDQVARLEYMLIQRAKLAKLSGYESHGHVALSDKMAKTPEAVVGFLDALAQENAPRVKEEMRDLLDIKRGDAHVSGMPGQLDAWDKDYYTGRLMSSKKKK